MCHWSLHIAAYMDLDGAQQDWDGIKQMVADKVIDVEAMALVSRDENGKIHVKDDEHHARHGAKKGAIGGALVGLIFPPTIIAGVIVGAAAGGVAGGVLTRVERRKIKADVEATLPVGSSPRSSRCSRSVGSATWRRRSPRPTASSWSTSTTTTTR